MILTHSDDSAACLFWESRIRGEKEGGEGSERNSTHANQRTHNHTYIVKCSQAVDVLGPET